MKIRVLIVDDEAHARARIRQALKDQPDFEVIGECANGREALQAIRRDLPDLVFLDIQMPRLTGFEVCAQLSKDGVSLPFIVFCTAYDQYALQAFEVHAIDYLLKPLDRDRFHQALDHVRAQARGALRGPGDQRFNDLLDALQAGAKQTDRLVFKQDGRVIFVRANTIDWVEADGNYVRFHCGNEAHYVRETLTGLEAQLPADKFMRVSRSAIVNLDRIKEFQQLFYGDYAVILQTGARLTLSRNYRNRLEKLLGRPRP
jgi:two-component system, LytTR family, response regulator